MTTLILGAEQPAAAGDTFAIARLERVQGEVTILRQGGVLTPRLGEQILRRDRITTADTSRASILFPDGSRLLLGAYAAAVVEDFLQEDRRQRGTIMLDVPYGPFRLLLSEPSSKGRDKQVVVRTRGNTLLVKSSDLWAGPIDGGTGILSIVGSIQVRNAGGSLVLDRKRQGTMIRDSSIDPERPSVWPREKIERALTQVAFD